MINTFKITLAFVLIVLGATMTFQGAQKIPILIVTGQNNHDWEYTSQALKDILERTGRFTPEITKEPSNALANQEALRKFKAFVLDYNGQRWGEPAETNFLEAVKSGIGVVVIHAANNAFPGWTEYERLVADCWRKGTGHGRFHSFDVKITDRNHPITKGLADLKSHPDELYHNLVHTDDVPRRILATAFSSPESRGTGKDEPMIMVLQYGKGRVFHTPLGHVWRKLEETKASFADGQFQLLVARGTEWAATGNSTIREKDLNRTARDSKGPNSAPLLVAANSTTSSGLTSAEQKAGWKPLFDGKTTTGWRSYRSKEFPEKGWVIENGCLKNTAGARAGDLITTRQYDNFELELDWKIAPGGNSGIIYRVSDDQPETWHTGPEYQILDDEKHSDRLDPRHSTGAVYDLIAPQNKILHPAGTFNHTRLVVNGNHVEHWLNGKKIAQYEFGSQAWNELVAKSKFAKMPKFGRVSKGHIALQDHGDEVTFCNIKIRELPAR